MEPTRLAGRIVGSFDPGQPRVGDSRRASLFGAAWRTVGPHVLADCGAQHHDGRGEVLHLERTRRHAGGETVAGGIQPLERRAYVSIGQERNWFWPLRGAQLCGVDEAHDYVPG